METIDLENQMVTDILIEDQLPIEQRENFKLNYDILMKNSKKMLIQLYFANPLK